MKLCKPYRSPLQAVFIIAFTVVMVLLSAALVRYFPDIAVYLRLTGGAFLLLGAVLLFRYTLTEFVYVLSENTLTVRRIIGLTERVVATLTLDINVELYTKAQFKKIKTAGGKSYRQNITANTAYLVFEKRKRRHYIEIEPNAPFYALIKAELDKNKEDKENK